MYRLRVMVNGRPIPVYHDNEGRAWIEARENTRFELKVENDGYSRFLAVVSVDGLNVINAKHEDPKEAPGYIVNSKSSISIPGWLIDENQTREFVFSKRGTAYANKIGTDTSNIGVIGCAIFNEQYSTITWYSNDNFGYNKKWDEITYRDFNPYYTTSGVSNTDYTVFNSSVSDSNTLKATSLGVGSGDKVDFSTTTSTFTRIEKPAGIVEIYYDDRQGLLDRGIILDKKPLPRAFPIGQKIGYCPDV